MTPLRDVTVLRRFARALDANSLHGAHVAYETWGALNFYENALFPYRWNSAITEQITKRFSPNFSLSMNHQDYHQIPQGAPESYPNDIHVGAWNIFADFHLDLNQMFH